VAYWEGAAAQHSRGEGAAAATAHARGGSGDGAREWRGGRTDARGERRGRAARVCTGSRNPGRPSTIRRSHGRGRAGTAGHVDGQIDPTARSDGGRVVGFEVELEQSKIRSVSLIYFVIALQPTLLSF
jgi:hypothetical protein